MITPGQQIYTNAFTCPECSQPVVNRMPHESAFVLYACTNTACPDVNVLALVEKVSMTVLTVQHPTTLPTAPLPVTGNVG